MDRVRPCFVRLEFHQVAGKNGIKFDEKSQNLSPLFNKEKSEPKFGVINTKYTGKKPFQCSYCGARFKIVELLSAHYERLHLRRESTPGSAIMIADSGQGAVKVEVESENELNVDDCSEDQEVNVDVCSEDENHETDNTHLVKVLETGGTDTVIFGQEGEIVEKRRPRGRRGRAQTVKHGCKFCAKQFKFLSALKMHERQHTGEKPYPCAHCEKRFSIKGNLMIHLRVHNGEKHFACSTCNKKFSHKMNLQTHEKRHVVNREVPVAKLSTPTQCEEIECNPDLFIPESCEESSAMTAKEARSGKTKRTSLSRNCKGKDYAAIEGDEPVEADRPTSKKKARRDLGGERKFPCKYCRKGFRHASTLKLHETKHTRVKPFQCGICGSSFSLRGSLKTHQRLHTGEKPFQCELCSKSFVQLSCLIKHRTVHLGAEGGKLYECDVCNKKFSLLSQLMKHRKRHEGTADEPFRCEYCSQVFSEVFSLRMHNKSHSGKHPAYECEVCFERFQTYSTLNFHKIKHRNDRPFKCSFCKEDFKYKRDVKLHEIQHTGELPFKCSVCSETFGQKSSLNTHMDAHVSRKASNTVPKRSAGKRRPVTTNVPDDKMPFRCQVCGRRFRLKSYLRIHSRTHTGEKPYRCGVCNKAFSQPSSLRNHKTLHTGELRYKCSFCDRPFKWKASASQHEQRCASRSTDRVQDDAGGKVRQINQEPKYPRPEMRPHQCLVCGKVFTQKVNLHVHLRVHTGEKPYQCDVCSKCFSQKSGLDAHTIRIHVGWKGGK